MIGTPHHRRKAVSLLELLLVLALVSIAASLTLPSLAVLLADRRLNRAADLIQIEVSKTRIDAMRQGRVLLMRGTPGANELSVAVYQYAGDATEASSSLAGPSALLSGADQAMVTTAVDTSLKDRTIELPESIQFAGIAVLQSLRANAMMSQTGTIITESGQNIVPDSGTVFFYPDGTTSDAAIAVADEDGRQFSVVLRGVTGSTQIVERNEELDISGSFSFSGAPGGGP